jgi:starvation-inducible DNA-binding protein
MSKLSDAMKTLWADNFVVYTKAHGFHVNVTGDDFSQYHAFLEKIYTTIYEYVDRLGEGIRTLDEVAPFSLKRVGQLTSIKDETIVPDECDMVKELYMDIETLKMDAIKCFDLAQTAKTYGLQNILADYLEDMEKICWMLRASMEDPAVEAAEMAADAEMGIPEEPTPKI